MYCTFLVSIDVQVVVLMKLKTSRKEKMSTYIIKW